ncbi:MAG: hypothetical protein QNJ94_18560 [Alphaproteobacteria bacterium]|nr:hypothetical protein [Alphaproteobacteria bacterium]
MATSQFEIASRAMVLLGAGDISSFDESEGDRAVIAGQLYPAIRLNLIAEHPWRFAMVKSLQLNRSTSSPGGQWQYAFALPPDMIGAPYAVYYDNSVGAPSFTRWERFGAHLYSDEERLYIDYKQLALEPSWPAYFDWLMILECAWVFAEPVTDDSSKRDEFRTMARGAPSEMGKGGQFRIAAQADAMGNPSPQVAGFDLIAARMGGG